MTEIIRDNLEVDMTIGGDPWLLSDAVVELTRNNTPNYVDINKMVPDRENGTDFTTPNELLGEPFELHVDTSLISERDTDAEEETLLFKGSLANISATGTEVYEGIAYDPSQQALNTGGRENDSNILHQQVEFQNPKREYSDLIAESNLTTGTGEELNYDGDTIGLYATQALEQLIDQVPIDRNDVDIQITGGGKVLDGAGGTYRGAYDSYIIFEETNDITVADVLSKIEKQTKSYWWFDKEGVLHFGIPEPTVHSPQLITDTSAGLTTPPYQSVKIIGSDVASREGYARAKLNPDEPIVFGANLVLAGVEQESGGAGGGQTKDEVAEIVEKEVGYGSSENLRKPTFVYESQEIITEKMAKNTAQKIAEDLVSQYASGKVKVVGFPEIEVFDVIIMPHAQESQQDVANYSPRQPMGGGVFGVHTVKHKINPSDGFITEIEVAGMAGPASVVVDEDSFVNGTGLTDDQSDEPTGVEPVGNAERAKRLETIRL